MKLRRAIFASETRSAGPAERGNLLGADVSQPATFSKSSSMAPTNHRQPGAILPAGSGNHVSLSPGERAGVRAGSLSPTLLGFISKAEGSPIANLRSQLTGRTGLAAASPAPHRLAPGERGSILVIVLWVAIALVSIVLYFANTMHYELTASDNRMNGIAADQAIEGAARYVALVLQNFATNGAMPQRTQFKCAAVPIGDAHFWLIGRDAGGNNLTEPAFGLVDETAKLNLNSVSTNILQYLPNVTMDFASAILDWRGTNGNISLDYTSLGYASKNAPFETVDELRLVYGATQALLVGDDVNRNGVLDKNEKSSNGSGLVESGLLEDCTVYTREPNYHLDGSSLTNVSTCSKNTMTALLQNSGLSTSYVNQLIATNVNARPYHGLFGFALRSRNAGMTSSDFASLVNNITTSTNTYLRNRVNVNTANSDVLTALFMGLNVDQSTAESAAQTLVTYRQQNPNNLTSVAWVIDALGTSSSIVTALATGDFITTHTYQFTADIAAVGAYGRGYRRVKFVFDVSDGTPKILYRQDLSRLGWALGDQTRQTLLAQNTPK